MFVLCVMYSKGQKAKPGQRSSDKVQSTENKENLGIGIFLFFVCLSFLFFTCCVVTDSNLISEVTHLLFNYVF
jgi:hypothetical protein